MPVGWLQVYTWGTNDYGQLGNGSTTYNSVEARLVADLCADGMTVRRACLLAHAYMHEARVRRPSPFLLPLPASASPARALDAST